MFWFFSVLSLLPFAFLARMIWRGWSWSEAARIAVLAGIAAIIADPFITRRGVGTGEAYNYVHAVADTVAQMRAGVFPVYVGQSEYAFNGRVHPLRTAVYYTHAAGLLDCVTFHQLGFWALQNLSLALSLWGAVFSLYACVRALGAAPPWVCVGLAALYGFCPALLAAAHGSDLYMTVTAAPFLPLAVLGAVRSWQGGNFRDYALMAAALAVAWLAHPPIAAWTTLGCGVLVGFSFLRRGGLHGLIVARLAACALLGIALSAWAFVSALSLREGIIDPGGADLMVPAITQTTKTTGWAALAPVQQGGTALGDFQLGYAAWLGLAVVLWFAVRTRRGELLAIATVAIIFLLLTLPVPGVHARLWSAMPAAFASLTNIWPMQRSYLVMTPFILFGVALAWPQLATWMSSSREKKWTAGSLAVAALAWTMFQGTPFLRHSYAARKTAEDTRRSLLPVNLNLTSTAYALMPIPSRFYHGARDPGQEMRLLALDGRQEILANANSAGLRPAAASGMFRFASDNPLDPRLEPALELQPGKKYRLNFEFLVPPLEAPTPLRLIGDSAMQRDYVLPSVHKEPGYGLGGEHRSTLTLWTPSDHTEKVTVTLHPGEAARKDLRAVAKFTLEEIATDRLPIRLEQLVPDLKCTLDSPAEGWLETPRIFVRGYEAFVDGNPVFPRRSSEGLTLVPIPVGRHSVELRYRAPPLLRFAAILSVSSWVMLGAAVLLFRRVPQRTGSESMQAGPVARPVGMAVLGIASVVILVAGAVWWFRSSDDTPPRLPGPLRLRVVFPSDAAGFAEPLISGGAGTGSTVFVRYLLDGTVKLGIDIAGAGVKESPPLSVDLRVPHEITFTSGIIYPNAEKPLREVAGAELLTWLQTHTRVWLDGREILYTLDPAPPRAGPVALVGKNPTANAAYRKKFTGLLLEREWLPLEAAHIPWPTTAALARDAGPLRITAMLPRERVAQCEPLLTLGDKEDRVCLFVHYLDAAHVRLGVQGPAAGLVFTEPLPFDYARPLEVVVSHPVLYPKNHAQLSGYSEQQRALLLSRVRVALGGRWLLSVPLAAKAHSEPGTVFFGRNTGGASYPAPAFQGIVAEIKREPGEAWLVPPGNPEAALAPGTAGALEITALLPTRMSGRAQPLLTTGRTGEGAFVILRYVDASHVQVGLDVWNKSLTWSDPVEIDYERPHRFVVSLSALHPLDHPEVRALPEAARAALRQNVRVSLDDREVLHVPIFAYDAPVTAITPGASHIGGSNTEAAFLGEIIAVRRLPVSKP